MCFYLRPDFIDLLTTRIFALAHLRTLWRQICTNTGLTQVVTFNLRWQLGLLAGSSLTGVYCCSCFNHHKANLGVKSLINALSNSWFGALKSNRSYWAFRLSLG